MSIANLLRVYQLTLFLVFTTLTVSSESSKINKVCCFPEQYSGELYHPEWEKYFHLAVDYKKAKLILKEKGRSDVYQIGDLNTKKQYFFNGTTQCYGEEYGGHAQFHQCMYATPDNVHDLLITVPQGDIKVKAISEKTETSDVVWFVYSTGVDTCYPLLFRGTVAGKDMDFFHAHMRDDLGGLEDLFNVDISHCSKKD